MKRLLLLFIVLALSAGCHSPRSDMRSVDQPLIGVTSIYIKSDSGGVDRMMGFLSYVEAVKHAGAIPVVLPPLDDDTLRKAYVDRLDGLLLVGGRDIPPDVYGEKAVPEVVEMARERWTSESALLKAWLSSQKPVLGICLGSQFANVVQGGSLIQDIPSQVGTNVVHSSSEGAMHAVTIESGTRLHDIVGQDRISVWGRHHQAVKEIGDDLVITARSDDRVVEATELPNWPFAVFVQWHPERTPEKDHSKKLFKALVEASSGKTGDDEGISQ